jgi:hypothetical protein
VFQRFAQDFATGGRHDSIGSRRTTYSTFSNRMKIRLAARGPRKISGRACAQTTFGLTGFYFLAAIL